MVYIPAVEFLMGYEGSEADEDEGLEHLVYLFDYWFNETPITNIHYRRCIKPVVCTGSLSRFPEDNLPAVSVDWEQANTYCEWAVGRLPMKAEWEKAVRGSDARLFPWSTQSIICRLTNFQGCCGKQIEVGSFPEGASPYEALDILGTVWDWVSDWYSDDYYIYSPLENPTDPIDGEFRVQRGHSFETNPIYLRVPDRGRSYPSRDDYRKGFRCVISDLY
jgi:formylglycine-generating enzyme required for sulfatase activity